MVAFARARTRSWLSRLWPISVQLNNNQTAELDTSNKLLENQLEQNKCFLEASKNGGIWFS